VRLSSTSTATNAIQRWSGENRGTQRFLVASRANTRRLASEHRYRIGAGEPVTSGNAGEVDIDSSPDGRKLAYRTMRGGKSELREFDTTNRQEKVLLASMDWRPTTPRWSADGRHLAYTRAEGGEGAIESPVAVLSADGKEERLINLPGGAYLVPTHWSQDGPKH
jgi:Tol biopolymer transport system component